MNDELRQFAAAIGMLSMLLACGTAVIFVAVLVAQTLT
jgi:hypothetical protein